MALQLTRAVSQRFIRAGRQLRDVSQFWLRRSPAGPRAETLADSPQHVFNHLHKSGEMNHMGRCRCDACDGEMALVPAVGEAADIARYDWQCAGCGARDETSFCVCRCGRQTVLEKHAANVRVLPVSLNAGGCTECERCVVCDGVLVIGNLKWFYGRWTHLYPDTEFDRRTMQEYTVTRERAKHYGFHCHFSCHQADPQAVQRHLDSLVPDWYAEGHAKQQAEEESRLHRQGRCLACRGRLDVVSRLLDQDRHPQCR